MRESGRPLELRVEYFTVDEDAFLKLDDALWLLTIFRALSPEAQQRLLDYARFLKLEEPASQPLSDEQRTSRDPANRWPV